MQEKSLERRLIHEREILEASTKFLRAKVALQSAFTPETPISAEGIVQGVANDESKTEQATSAADSIASDDTSKREQSTEESQSADQSSDAPKSGQDGPDSS